MFGLGVFGGGRPGVHLEGEEPLAILEGDHFLGLYRSSIGRGGSDGFDDGTDDIAGVSNPFEGAIGCIM